MAKIRIIVMGFASHRTWAEGYQRAAASRSSSKKTGNDNNNKHNNNIQINVISPDRWKFRMMVASVEFMDLIEDDDDIVIVDGMFDISVLVALLKSSRPNKCPKVLVYLHENQLTTPFTNQDRDIKNQTSWHYGMAHYRSLMVADGFIFNSTTHLEAFKQALPKLINEQCPRDNIQYQLQNVQELLQTKCTTLQYGLELDELEQVDHKVDNDGGGDINDQQQATTSKTTSISNNNLEITNTKKNKIPTILWNARLEEDKNPAAFLDMLHQIRRRKLKRRNRNNKEEDDEENNNKSDDQQEVAFQLIILGMDPSKDKIWEKRIQKEFAKELLFMGWCTDRKQYSSWLHKSSIIISTAKHETVGISVVESVYCGALPLLPNRLSYPELFPPDQFMENHLYSTTRGDGVDKLFRLLDVVANHPTQHHQLQQQTKSAITRFRWSVMGSIYDHFFDDIVAGEPLTLAGIKAESTLKMMILDEKDVDGDDEKLIAPRANRDKILTTNTLEAAADTTTVPWQLRQEEIIKDATDDRVALYRPKSLRNHKEYNKQINEFGIEVTLHGGRRATVRMLEAMSVTGAKIKPISFLTTRELANTIFLGGGGMEGTIQSKQQQDKRRCLLLKDTPLYVADNKELLDEIRGQKLNSGDSVLCMIQFPISCDDLSELIANPPILILDNVRNAENVGSILRTAFCLGITSVVATSGTAWAAIKDSRAARCSMGTIYYHKYYQSTNLIQTIKTIQEKGDGIKVYGVEIGSNAVPVQPHGHNKNWAAIVGNEDIGLNNDVATACDKIVFIPQYHGDSLNVGHAAAITMFELGRECNFSSTTTPIKHDGLAACT